jgi:hypothetical protein
MLTENGKMRFTDVEIEVKTGKKVISSLSAKLMLKDKNKKIKD